MTADLSSTRDLGSVPDSSSFVKAFAAVAAACVCALRTRGLLQETQAAARLSACERFYLKGCAAPAPTRPLEAWADDFLDAHTDMDGLVRSVFSRGRILAASGNLAALVDLAALASVLRGSIFVARRLGDTAEEDGLGRLGKRVGDLAVRLEVLPLEEDVVFPLASIVGLPLRADAGSFDARVFGTLHEEIAGTVIEEPAARESTEIDGDEDALFTEDGGIGREIELSLSAVGRVIDRLSERSKAGRGVPAWRSSSLDRNRLPFP